MLEGLDRPPLFHCFGHVHAKQRNDEPPEGAAVLCVEACARYLIRQRRGGAPTAGHHGVPSLENGRRAQAPVGRALRSARARKAEYRPCRGYMPPLTPDEWLHHKFEEKPWLLMRPPTVVILPLEFKSRRDCAAKWRDSRLDLERSRNAKRPVRLRVLAHTINTASTCQNLHELSLSLSLAHTPHHIHNSTRPRPASPPKLHLLL